MNNQIRCIFVLILCLFSFNFRAQSSDFGKEKMSHSLASEIEGTIQVEFLTSEENKAFALTTDIIQKIDQIRSDDKITFLEITKGCRVKIFPRNMIRQENFKINEDYVIVNEFKN